LVANTIYAQPKNAAVGIGIILIGLPAYWFWRSKQKRVSHEDPKSQS